MKEWFVLVQKKGFERKFTYEIDDFGELSRYLKTGKKHDITVPDSKTNRVGVSQYPPIGECWVMRTIDLGLFANEIEAGSGDIFTLTPIHADRSEFENLPEAKTWE